MSTPGTPSLIAVAQASRQELLSFFRARISCRETANDLCQELFLRIARLESLQHILEPRAYLFRTAANLVAEFHRSRTRRSAALTELAHRVDGAVDHLTIERQVSGDEQIRTLCAVLAELPPLCQRVCYLYWIEGLRQPAIAERLGISRRAVENHVRRAMLHCSRRLDLDV